MKLKKREIQKIKAAHKKAINAKNVLENAIGSLNSVIIETTNVSGNVDYLTGHGFGFTLLSDYDDTHIPIDTLIKLSEDGVDITEDEIFKYLSI